MKLRQKTLLIVGGALMSLTAVLYATSFAIVLNRYQQVEEQEMRLNVIRTLEALQNELETLQVTSTDYSAWDD
ncbi:hypothetical protein, partial [Neosynechococcus sphagnicola]